MSGTSLDGIDAALVSLRPAGQSYTIELIDFATSAYDAALGAALTELLPPNPGTAARMAAAHKALGEAYADAAAAIAAKRRIDYVAMHGQTVFHDGDRSQTLQLGSPYFLRDRLQATVCFDFRSADCALGGHGAPLVPYVDYLLLSSEREDRVAVNIGGIANLTFMPRGGASGDAVAFDSGPGNMLIDAFVARRSDGTLRYDADGALAARGTVSETALRGMLADAYFAQPAPKSTGRERFGAQFLDEHRAALDALSLEDGAATLSALTAVTLAGELKRVAASGTRVLISGGGTHNRTLVRMIEERLIGYDVEATPMRLAPDAKEAIAFALLGYETLRARPANLPRVTGAAGPAVLGAIVPCELPSLLERVRSECAE
ncbi:MAG: anhydro-N-acetylmuramic acid kinase [Candidatus Eremiobacteraeota bacterium]|nr:anhydro-N-acetylmuramic acid kinase [Candidatus Eremiobacteraeota bacterium]